MPDNLPRKEWIFQVLMSIPIAIGVIMWVVLAFWCIEYSNITVVYVCNDEPFF